MKKITFLFMTLLTVIMVNAQFAYQTIKTDGFETSEGLPATFTRTGQAAWSTATAPYTGGFWDLIFASTTPKDYTVSAYSSDFRSGAQCVKVMTGTSTVPLRLRSVTNSPFTPSIVDWAKYKITIWAKATAGKQIFDKITTLATGGWDKYEFVKDYSTGLSETRLMIDLKATAGTSTEILLDDITVEKYNQVDPTTIVATSVNETSFTANWNVLAGASSYRLTVQTSVDGTTWTTLVGFPKTITGNSTVSESVTGLTNNTQYRYKIEGFDGTYYSPSSNLTNITTSTTTAIIGAQIKNIFVKDGKIYVETKANQPIAVYNSVGQQIHYIVAKDGINELTLSKKGVYVIKVNQQSQKIIL